MCDLGDINPFICVCMCTGDPRTSYTYLRPGASSESVFPDYTSLKIDSDVNKVFQIYLDKLVSGLEREAVLRKNPPATGDERKALLRFLNR